MTKRRYALTEYTKASDVDMCNHARRIPGLDADICPECQMAWTHPWTPPRAQPQSVATMFIGSLTDFADLRATQPVKSVAAIPANRPRTNPRQSKQAIAPLPNEFSFTYAITLKRPWPYAIAHLGKDLENRSWRNFMKPGEWLAIHAGRGYVFDDADWIQEAFDVQLPEAADQPTGIVAIARFLGNVTASDSPWFNGSKYAWRLGEVHPLARAVDCKGRRGLWKPEQGVKEQVYGALKVR